MSGTLKSIGEFKAKTAIVGIDEVHELQSLFNTCLWMFGSNFESIDFTSNVGMTKVIHNLFNKPDITGSRKRPDFVVIPDGNVGFYSTPSFDYDNHEVDGVSHLVIIDLKTTGLKIGEKEKSQVWNYIKELNNKGIITKSVRVDAFVLGDSIEAGENDARNEGNACIKPMLYSTLLNRAETRMLNLYEKVKDSKAIKDHIQATEQRLAVAQSATKQNSMSI
jgi:hypothetical protein